MSEVSTRASRLATPRWIDARLVFGVLLVLLSVVAGARIFASADRYTEVYVARAALVPGEQLRAADLSVGRVRFAGNGAAYIAASNGAPVGYLVRRYVGSGELVPLAALSASRSAIIDERLVTVPVDPGHLPDDLGHGDLVDVYVTAKAAAGATVPAPARVLSSVAVDDDDDGSSSLSGGSTVSLVLDVPGDQVAMVVRAVESGTIDVVRVPDAVVAGTGLPAGAAAGSW